jgi:hypothetical protein
VLPANYASKVALRNPPRALSANWVNAQDDKKDILPINLFAGAPEGFGCRFCNSTLQPAAASAVVIPRPSVTLRGPDFPDFERVFDES